MTEAEHLLIATALANADALTLTRGRVTPEDFSDRRLGALYAALEGQYADGAGTDPFSVHARAKKSGMHGIELHELYRWMDLASPAVSATVYADEIRDASLRRRLSDIARIIGQVAHDQGTPVADSISRSLERLTAIRDGATGGDGLDVKTLGEILASEDDPEDWVIPGLFERGDRMIVTGYEGLGKTTWLRQVGISAAAGLDPVTWEPLDHPVKCMFVDVENSERQWRRETFGMAGQIARRGAFDPRENVHVHTGGRMDIRKDRDLGLVHRLVDEHRPDILFIGPLYRLTPNGMNNDEEAAPVIAALDTLRDRGLVLVMEAHAPKGVQGERSLAPRGSAALMGWPEFGFGMAPSDLNEDGRPMAAELVRWRGDRDRGRRWPKKMWQGGPLPWTADEVSMETRNIMYGRQAA